VTFSLLCGIRLRVLAGALWVLTIAAVAQESNTAWLVRSWRSDDGLPENTVLSLARTPDDYIWIGTPIGLARFDGFHFESFSLTNMVASPNLGVTTLLRASNGALWLGMDRGGVVCLDGKASRAFIQGLPQQIPNGLVEDAQGERPSQILGFETTAAPVRSSCRFCGRSSPATVIDSRARCTWVRHWEV
jgi:hypothetical protein